MAITSRVTKQVSSPMTKRNPRPRKYASQAERQAAYRARNVMLEFRAEPKTADNVSKIADTLGYPRSDVLLSMVKFALTNHDWARFGLTHKTIPTYRENPMQSWMIVNKQTGEAVLETYNKDILSKLNTEKYEAIPALKYLVALNKKIKENPMPGKTFLMSVGQGKPKVETPYDFGFTHYIPMNSYGGNKVAFKFYAHEDGTLTAISEAESGKRVGVIDTYDSIKYGQKTAAKKVIENLLQRHGADKVYAVLSKG